MKIKSTLTTISFLLFTSFQMSATAQAVNVQDSLALVDLYNNTHGPNWARNDGWLSEYPVSLWWGITVENSRVKNIQLWFNNLTGNIPPTIGNLSGLTRLELFSNHLSSIPAQIGNLSNLAYLDLSLNQLTSVPVETGNLSNLEYLDLSSNQITSIPAELSKLSILSVLVLNNNTLTKLPSELGKLASLDNLNIERNQLTNLPPEIGNLSSLTELRLTGNNLTSLPAEIGNLSKLSELWLLFNQLTGIPAEIGNLTNLTILDLASNQLTDLPAEIGNLSNLVAITLSVNQLTSIPSEMSNLTSLTRLYLSKNQLTSIPAEIGKLPKLAVLDLSHNQLSNVPPEIGKLARLKILKISDNQLNDLSPEIDDLPNLKRLTLFNNHLNFEPLEMVVKKLGNKVYYFPQAIIPVQQNGVTLSVSAGGTLSNNTYNWHKVGKDSESTFVGDSVFHPVSSGKYYATVTNSVCSQLTLYSDTIYYDAVLPVSLINFKAQQNGGMVKVDWISVTEINVDRYEIQRAADAQNFIGIGSLPSRGNGTQRINYSFNDVKPLQGNNYYRLKASDKDAAITYSNMVLVKMNSDKAITLVYPNPAKNILNIQLNGSATFSLINQSGKTILTRTINNSAAIDVSHFAAGLYYLKNNNTGEVQKIIVVK